jgi:hypothetical protein
MTITLFIVSAALMGFMINRLYLMATYKSIDVKGQRYDKTADPIQFWLFVGFACFGMLFGLGLLILSSAALFGLL